MSIVLQSSGGGQITIQEPATASNFTQTLPAASGEVMVSGNQPAFRAYLSSNQTLTSATLTKITLNAENFDTASAFDTATYRFTPQVAGYYQFNVVVGATAVTSLTYNYFQIYKNAVSDAIAIYAPYSGVSSYGNLTSLIYLNGTTDYVELYATLVGTGALTIIGSATSASTYMSGCLVKAA